MKTESTPTAERQLEIHENGKEKKNKEENYPQIVMWTCILFSVGTCTRYIIWVSLHRAKPNNQPKYSSKEESYFKELEKRDNWRDLV